MRTRERRARMVCVCVRASGARSLLVARVIKSPAGRPGGLGGRAAALVCESPFRAHNKMLPRMRAGAPRRALAL